jgi:pyruvate,water dikinase
MLKFFKKDKDIREKALTQAFRVRYDAFQRLLHDNNAVLELMADMEEKSSGDFLFDMNYIEKTVSLSIETVSSIISNLNVISHDRYKALNSSFEQIKSNIEHVVRQRTVIPPADLVIPLSSVTSDMTLIAGGKMANIGEMRNRLQLPVPEGFVISSSAFREFMQHNSLADRLKEALKRVDLKDTAGLEAASREFQKMIMDSSLPPEIEKAIRNAADDLRRGGECTVSVRSSALAEDGHFSFAGQYATYLNVRPDDIPERYCAVLASLFTPRALYYAASKGFSGEETAMAVGVMRMIPASAGGVMYSQDPNGQQPEVMIINGSWGLAKQVVDGTGKTDRFLVSRDSGEVVEQSISDKEFMIVSREEQGVDTISVSDSLRALPCINPEQIRTLAAHALVLEQHFGILSGLLTPQEKSFCFRRGRSESSPMKPENRCPAGWKDFLCL